MKIYVGNLAREITEAELHQIFARYGQVESITMCLDKGDRSGTSPGFAFVEMLSDAEAQAALDGLYGYIMNGRLLIVR